MMRNIALALIILAAVGLLSAIVSVLMESTILGISAEQFSRICSNLALISIALAVWFKKVSISE
ncbi:MAG: hypothetical protein K9N35_02590 [Candidatus Marinimicrobia bacterium]|nr:hypothetical protein [Candidatus Neomarinimicrobiota bacterium]